MGITASFAYSSLFTPLGESFIAWTEEGICALSINSTEADFLDEMSRTHSGRAQRARKCLKEASDQLAAYFAGEARAFRLPLDLSRGTTFQKDVWNGLLSIPYGETRDYRWLAEQVGRPKAFRAVGQANGANPIPVIVPCHRVICADGTMGGYSGGLEIKRKLLKIEGIRCPAWCH